MDYRFGAVLALIGVSIAFQLAAPEGDGARLVTVLLQAATLVAAVTASRAHQWVLMAAWTVAVLGSIGALAAVIGTEKFDAPGASSVTLLLVALAPPAIANGVRKQFQRDGRVTIQTMAGALCLYLLIGLLFSTTYATADAFSDRDFFLAQGAVESDDYLYFSFVTLTTTGYGDLVAATELGRSLAITEALFGQIYLVTVVALVVGNLRPAGRAAAPDRSAGGSRGAARGVER